MYPAKSLDELFSVEDDFERGFSKAFGKIEPTEVQDSLRRVLEHHRVACMVFEKAYTDRDFAAAYHMQAGRAFSPSERVVLRVHFFSRRFTLGQLDSADADTELQENYVGCSVVWPDEVTLGSTLIKPPKGARGVQADYPVSLMGHGLWVSACPYMSQDRQVTVCATAALWMATSPISRRDADHNNHTTSEITRLARGLHRGYGPAIARVGLVHDEMVRALFEMDYDPVVSGRPEPADLQRACEAYVNSGFAPVIVMHPDRPEDDPHRNGANDDVHAMTVVGHFDGSGLTLLPSDGNDLVDTEDSSYDLIVHDDQQGIYLEAKLTHSGMNDEPCRIDFKDGLRGGLITSVMIAVPSHIMVDLVDVMAQAQFVLARGREKKWTGQRATRLRPMLVRSRDFKQGLAGRGMPRYIERMYRRLPMPRYIWLVELAYDSEPGDKIYGELIFDSTWRTVPDGLAVAEHIEHHLVVLVVDGDRTWPEGADTGSRVRYSRYLPPSPARDRTGRTPAASSSQVPPIPLGPRGQPAPPRRTVDGRVRAVGPATRHEAAPRSKRSIESQRTRPHGQSRNEPSRTRAAESDGPISSLSTASLQQSDSAE